MGIVDDAPHDLAVFTFGLLQRPSSSPSRP
jgi:hypothetical protein